MPKDVGQEYGIWSSLSVFVCGSGQNILALYFRDYWCLIGLSNFANKFVWGSLYLDLHRMTCKFNDFFSDDNISVVCNSSLSPPHMMVHPMLNKSLAGSLDLAILSS